MKRNDSSQIRMNSVSEMRIGGKCWRSLAKGETGSIITMEVIMSVTAEHSSKMASFDFVLLNPLFLLLTSTAL